MTAPTDNIPITIIQDAYFDAGLLSEGDSINGEQLVSGMRRLTDLINLWQTQGIKLWLNVDTVIVLLAGTGTYTLGPAGSVVMVKPTRILDAYYLSSDSIRSPLVSLAWADYIQLGQVTQTGQLNSYFVDKQATQLSVTFWPIPDAAAALGTAHLLLQTQVTNFISVTETMNFPVEWRIALRWGLADELATGQPQAIMDRCQQRAETYRTLLENWDVEDAPVRFTPDQRATQSTGAFR